MRQHQAQLAQANAAAELPPMADPFPSLVNDPFPPQQAQQPAAAAARSLRF